MNGRHVGFLQIVGSNNLVGGAQPFYLERGKFRFTLMQEKLRSIRETTSDTLTESAKDATWDQ